ncbi:L,D-transpeptidase family protein [Paracoccus homiensis]|uniref:L,D-transpeptidase family protein n=1 Tax=Paracoccus homiensis TaxID=364199 RepID=UPI00398D61A3
MTAFPYRIALATLLATTGLQAGMGHAETTFSADQIDAATYAGGDLPSGRSAITAKVQVLLDRSGISPGVVDGFSGGMSQSAIMAFERRAGLPMDGRMDPTVWQLLQPYAAAPVTMAYTITPEDAQGLVDAIPSDYAEKAAMSSQGFTSILEKLGERFHMDDKFITFLNPGAAIQPGTTIRVTTPTKPIKTKVSRIIIDKATRRVAAYDAMGDMIVDYPATVGSNDTPSPSGTHKVVTTAINPNYTYNPDKNFRQGENNKPLVIPPGPNGPVGSVWIDLSQPTYGIHGTPTPSRLFHSQSHGCVRLTNWDAEELAHMVIPGTTTVEFLEPGVTIADVTRPATPALPEVASSAASVAISARAPMARPVRDAATTTATLPPATLPPSSTAPLSLPQAATQAVQAIIPAAASQSPLPGGGQIFEDTTEENALPLPDAMPLPETLPEALPQSTADPLSDALSGALPDATVVAPSPQP